MWDPNKYLAFADHRGRPFYELLSRVDARSPRRVVDLGCGPGNLTVSLAERWPDAVLEASDSSPEMVEAARERGLDASRQDVRDWTPEPDTDVVVSNAALQWVPEHRELLRRWPTQLPSGGVDRGAGSRQLRRAVAHDRPGPRLERPVVPVAAGRAVPREQGRRRSHRLCRSTRRRRVCPRRVGDHVRATADRGKPGSGVDHRHRAPPGQGRPRGAGVGRFREELVPLLDEAYPRRPDGSTFFPFRRIFVVAQVQ